MADSLDITRDDTPTHIFSPLKKPLEIEIYSDDNNPEKVTVPAKEIVTYPTYTAKVIQKHIVDAIINERNLGYVTPEEREKLTKETEVIL